MNYVHELWDIALFVDHLISFELLEVEGLSESIYLMFFFVAHDGKVAEEVGFFCLFFLFYPLQNFVIFRARYHRKMAVCQTLDGRCSWLIIQQGQFTKTSTFRDSDDFDEPLHLLHSFYFLQFSDFILVQIQILENLKFKPDPAFLEALLESNMMLEILPLDLELVDIFGSAAVEIAILYVEFGFDRFIYALVQCVLLPIQKLLELHPVRGPVFHRWISNLHHDSSL